MIRYEKIFLKIFIHIYVIFFGDNFLIYILILRHKQEFKSSNEKVKLLWKRNKHLQNMLGQIFF